MNASFLESQVDLHESSKYENKKKHRGEAALRINCDTLDIFRTNECKEIIETVKINNIQQKRKISEN